MTDPDESTDEKFAEAVGRAIITWQRVESQSANVFTHLLDATGLGATAVFYHIKNTSTRTEMMNIAARFLFHAPGRKRMRAQWQKLSARLSEAATLRNRMAHFAADEIMTPTGWKFTLGPPTFDLSQLDPEKMDKWLQRQKRHRLIYSQVKNAWRDFNKLADDLQDFAHRILVMNQRAKSQQFDEIAPPHAQELGLNHLGPTAHLPLPPKHQKPRKSKRSHLSRSSRRKP